MQRTKARCTQQKLGDVLRRAAGYVKAPNCQRIQALRIAMGCGNQRLGEWNRRDLRRFANADFARMQIGD